MSATTTPDAGAEGMEAQARACGLRALDMTALGHLQPRFDLLPFVACARARCAWAEEGPGRLVLLLQAPPDVDRLAWAMGVAEQHEPVLVAEATLNAWLARCEAGLSAMDTMGAEPRPADAGAALHVEEISLRHIGQGEAAPVRLVNATFFDALRTGASDIHLEADRQGLNIRFRVDGVLNHQHHAEGTELAAQAVSRIKVMAQLDIAERRVPQDGRLQVQYEGRAIDMRVSIMPSIHGEDAVLRILDRQHLAQSLFGLTLAKLGFNEEAIVAMHRWSKKPHGMMLVTGPTGSGKTTTLYATIAETHHPRDKIITIEDPVEYQLPGVLQIPVNERKGLTFARGLRSILRHDPDKILVGEIRDAETAQIAVQSALTGHLVFTTVHANNVFDVVSRFGQFGVDAYTFASAVNGVVAQRLLRKVCEACAQPEQGPGSDVDVAALGVHVPGRWRKAHGCEVCRGTGYAGRFALGEVLELSPVMKQLVAQRASLAELQAEAARAGWQDLRTLALRAAASGLTTMEEVDRVAG
jgi:general secretion pathway protein E